VELVIETEEAERLARELAGVTGETVSEAVTKALAERLTRQKAAQAEADRLETVFARLRTKLNTRPMTPEEVDWAGGDDTDR
jgi:antitoxin VapB